MLFVVLSITIALLTNTIPVTATLGILSIQPTTVQNSLTNQITVFGSDFISGVTVSLDGYGSLSTTFIDSGTLVAVIPDGIPPGIYTVIVANPIDGSFASLPNALTVVDSILQPTATDQVSSYERPVVVILTYYTNKDSLTPGQDFDLFIQLYNSGQKTATNVVATFAVGDLIPRGTGGVVSVGNIAPDNRADLSQPFTVSTDVWGKSIAQLAMTLTYTDPLGMSYTTNYSITLNLSLPSGVYRTPTPTLTSTPSPTPTSISRPQLVITGYSTSNTPLQPGMQFRLELEIKNVGSSDAKQVTMIVGGGSASQSNSGTPEPGGISGSAGEFTNFAPLGTSNVQSIGNLPVENSITASQDLIVNVSTTPGAYPLKISFITLDNLNNVYTYDQVITLLVYSTPTVNINFYQDPNPIFAGQPNLLPIQIVNLGRNLVIFGNLTVSGQGAQFINNTTLIGPLDAGGYFTLDANIIPDQAGALELEFYVDYTDDFNQAQIITQSLTIDVQEIFIPEPDVPTPNGGEPIIDNEPETFWDRILRFILGFIGLDSAKKSSSESINLPVDSSSEGEFEGEPVPPLKGP
jgi:hypothetical protein